MGYNPSDDDEEDEEYTEREYTSKAGYPCVDANGHKMRILTPTELSEMFKEKHMVATADNPKSKYDFYADTDTWKYYAVKK